MAYTCPQCGHTAEQAGDCPTCNVPMEEAVAEEESSSEPQPSQPPESPEEKS